MFRPLIYCAVAAVGVINFTTLPAMAALVTATDFQNNTTNSLPHTYVVSNSDLLNGLTPTASAGSFTNETSGGLPVLTNGTFPSPITRDGGGPFQFSTFATGGNGGGTTVTYTLAATSNITGITVYGGWQDGGRDQQSYTVEYSLAGDPSTFIPLTTVNFNPGVSNGQPTATRVMLTDSSLGNLLTNVAALRFNFNATENGYSGYSEIDVFGTAVVPEPSNWAMLGLGAMGLVGLIRRRK